MDVHIAELPLAFLFPDDQDVFPVAVGGQAAGLADGFQEGDALAWHGKSACPADFTQDGKAEIHETDDNDGVFQVGFQFLDDHLLGRINRHAFQFHAAQHREVYVAIRIHQVALQGGVLATLHHLHIGAPEEVEGFGGLLVERPHHDEKHVVGLYFDAQLVADVLVLQGHEFRFVPEVEELGVFDAAGGEEEER